MLKNVPLPSPAALTARATEFAYPTRVVASDSAANRDVRVLWPLHPTVLIERARREAGLHDFGSETFLPSLTALCHSLDQEMDLNPAGRESACKRLLGILVLVHCALLRPALHEHRSHRRLPLFPPGPADAAMAARRHAMGVEGTEPHGAIEASAGRLSRCDHHPDPSRRGDRDRLAGESHLLRRAQLFRPSESPGDGSNPLRRRGKTVERHR